MGIAARGCYDLTKHGESSGKALDYLDAATNEKYVPHVIEPSIGVDRLFLALLTSAYREETVPPTKVRIMLVIVIDNSCCVRCSVLCILCCSVLCFSISIAARLILYATLCCDCTTDIFCAR